MVPRLLVQACEVVTCCWAVRAVARRGVWRDGARRESFLFQGEQCLNQSVCVCARAARPATRCGLDENEYCAALYGSNAASLRALKQLVWRRVGKQLLEKVKQLRCKVRIGAKTTRRAIKEVPQTKN